MRVVTPLAQASLRDWCWVKGREKVAPTRAFFLTVFVENSIEFGSAAAEVCAIYRQSHAATQGVNQMSLKREQGLLLALRAAEEILVGREYPGAAHSLYRPSAKWFGNSELWFESPTIRTGVDQASRVVLSGGYDDWKTSSDNRLWFAGSKFLTL
jgi:hypothetical protein